MANLINTAFSALGRILGLSSRSSRTSTIVNGGQLLNANFWSRSMATIVDGIPQFEPVTPLATLQDVQKELDLGASATDKDVFDGWTPVHYAVQYNTDPEIITLFLEQGADVNAKTNLGRTPLQLAARYNSVVSISTLLLDRGADIAAKNHAGLTALHFAALSNDNPRVIELLLDRGADLEARTNSNSTPLHLAAESNVHPDIVLKLLELGADLTAKDGAGNMPLHRALANNNLTVHDLLFDTMWEAG